MYTPSYFKADHPHEVISFMHAHPFITLCGCDSNNVPVATHVPILIEERQDKLFLVGHMMRETDHSRAFHQNGNVLALFSGAHAYISARWYNNPQQASTYNYMAVHAKGHLTFLNEDALFDVLSKTTKHFEKDADSPALVAKMPQEYVHKLMKAIVAFEIEIKELNHIFKLSQNKDERTYKSIIDNLEAGDHHQQEIAAAMKNRL